MTLRHKVRQGVSKVCDIQPLSLKLEEGASTQSPHFLMGSVHQQSHLTTTFWISGNLGHLCDPVAACMT